MDKKQEIFLFAEIRLPWWNVSYGNLYNEFFHSQTT
ncbi:MAG: hypothetical protein ACI85I_002871 [Arenicella sp.]|jgi:hypothetical protein